MDLIKAPSKATTKRIGELAAEIRSHLEELEDTASSILNFSPTRILLNVVSSLISTPCSRVVPSFPIVVSRGGGR